MAKEAGRKKSRISVLLNYVVIGAVLLASFLFVPEAYVTQGIQDQTVINIENLDNYFKKVDGDYWLYTDDEPVLSFTYIPEEMKDIPVIEEE